MQQYSCKGATQVPWFRFFTWKVCSLAEVHRKNLMLRINWEDRCHFWGKSSQSFQSDFPPFWIPFGSEKIVPLETCLQYPHDLCENHLYSGFCFVRDLAYFPNRKSIRTGESMKWICFIFGGPQISKSKLLIHWFSWKSLSHQQSHQQSKDLHDEWSPLDSCMANEVDEFISMIFPKFGYYIIISKYSALVCFLFIFFKMLSPLKNLHVLFFFP